MFIVPSQRDAKLRQERHVSATCRPAGAFGLGWSRAINMALLTELCRASFSVLRSSLIQWQCTPALSPLRGEGVGALGVGSLLTWATNLVRIRRRCTPPLDANRPSQNHRRTWDDGRGDL